MPYRPLRDIKWFKTPFSLVYRQGVVLIDESIPCKMYLLGDYHPGTFGIIMRLGDTHQVRVINQLPFKEAFCDADSPGPDMPPAGTNPTWTNLHWHGFWGPALEDNVYACIKPGQQKDYFYTLDRCHPPGLYIAHPHNFSSSVPQENIISLPINVLPAKHKRCKSHKKQNIPEYTLFLQLAYMQPCTPDDADQCELEVFDFANRPANEIATATKLLLTNGQIQPILHILMEDFKKPQPAIFRIGWMGIIDTLRFVIENELGERQTFRTLDIDSLPLADQVLKPKCLAQNKFVQLLTEFEAGHMQRFTVLALLLPGHSYVLKKVVNPEKDDLSVSSGERNLLYVELTRPVTMDCRVLYDGTPPAKMLRFGESNPVVTVPRDLSQKRTEKLLQSLVVNQNACWTQNVNRKFRNIPNIAAWRRLRFEYPMFPMIEGAMMDKESLTVPQITMVANRSEIWLVSSVMEVHSLHTHLMWFLIFADRDGPDQPWIVAPRTETWWQDTLRFDPNQEFIVWVMPFANHRQPPQLRATGKVMGHCHMGIHADSMMMLSLMVDRNEDHDPAGVGIIPTPDPSSEIFQLVKGTSFPAPCYPK